MGNGQLITGDAAIAKIPEAGRRSPATHQPGEIHGSARGGVREVSENIRAEWDHCRIFISPDVHYAANDAWPAVQINEANDVVIVAGIDARRIRLKPEIP